MSKALEKATAAYDEAGVIVVPCGSCGGAGWFRVSEENQDQCAHCMGGGFIQEQTPPMYRMGAAITAFLSDPESRRKVRDILETLIVDSEGALIGSETAAQRVVTALMPDASTVRQADSE